MLIPLSSVLCFPIYKHQEKHRRKKQREKTHPKSSEMQNYKHIKSPLSKLK